MFKNDYLARVYDEVSGRSAGETEFLQAVREVLESLEAYVEKHPELEQQGILERGGMEIPMRHVSASAASEYAPQYRLDGVRIGRRLYMDHPTAPLGTVREVCSWRAWVTRVRPLRAGDALGYGGHIRMPRDGMAATISVGYGDGLDPELVRVGGPVLIGGQRARLLACCMDQTVVDVTGIPCAVDDEVTLLGGDGHGNWLSSQEVSLLIGEDEGCGLTSRLSGRVGRVYL